MAYIFTFSLREIISFHLEVHCFFIFVFLFIFIIRDSKDHEARVDGRENLGQL